jgi:hypothetical protein
MDKEVTIDEGFIKDIVSSLKKIRNEMQANLPVLNQEIDDIIRSKGRNTARIEQTLDCLLNYMHM